METATDETTLHRLEEELHTELVPGTEVMVDVSSHQFIKSKHNRSVLVPQPSSDHHDPLNWSPSWKLSAITCSTLVTFVQGFAPLAIGPIFPELAIAFDSDLAGVVQFTGVTILVLGFSNFLWIPLSTTFGRRPVLLASTLLCIASNVWRAEAKTYSSFMGAAVLSGIGTGPCEALQPQITTDVTFLHQRGLYNTLYFAFFYASLMIGPIVAGAMGQTVGWRNFWWFNVALNVLVFLIILVAFPETMWHRRRSKPTDEGQQSLESTATGLAFEDKQHSQGSETKNSLAEATITVSDAPLGCGKPSKQQWRLFQRNTDPWKSLAYSFYLPWKIFPYPIVQFASFIVSFSSTSYLMINFTQAQAFAAPPYKFNSLNVGFTNFALLIGTFIGLFTAGPASDWVSAKLTQRNSGIREPEMRLLTMLPYIFIMILGNFIVSFGLQYHWDWKAIVVVGFACAGIQIAALPAIASTYAVDSYKPVSGAIFVSITVNKNLWGYGVSRFITPWIVQAGYVPPFMTNMSLTILWCLCGLVFWVWGKRFRRWTSRSSVHRAE